MNHQVFISYARADYEKVQKICGTLKNQNITFWIDQSDLPMGGDFPAKIAEAIEKANIVVFVSSAHSSCSSWVPREVIYADKMGKEIFPVRLDDAPFSKNLDIILPAHNHFDLFDLDDHNLRQFTDKLLRKLSNTITVNNNLIEFKRIHDESDPDLLELLKIYSELFEKSKNAAQEAIIKTIYGGSENHHSCLFLLKKSAFAIGFADVSYFVKEKMLYISYIGVLAPRLAGESTIYTLNIANGLVNYFEKGKMPIHEIVFDTENERLFKFFSRITYNRFKFRTFRIDAEFLQPRIITDNEKGVTEEEPYHFLWIPFEKSLQELNELPKDKVLSIIKAIYWNIFLQVTDGSSEEEYEKYLESLMERYEEYLPQYIKLIKA